MQNNTCKLLKQKQIGNKDTKKSDDDKDSNTGSENNGNNLFEDNSSTKFSAEFLGEIGNNSYLKDSFIDSSLFEEIKKL